MPHFWKKAPQARRTLIFTSATHVWSDLFFALYVPLLPLIKVDMELSFTEVALLKSAYAGSSAVLQVPAGFLAETIGEFWLLIGGNIWVAVGLIGMAAASGYMALLALTLVGGLGGGTQHPLASSMVSRAYDDRGRATAVGTVNFAGDLGKMVAPMAASLIAIAYGWRVTMRAIGVAAVVFMGLSVLIRRSVDISETVTTATRLKGSADDNGDRGGFIALSVIGFLDSGARGAGLTFLPFIMEDKGMDTAQIYWMLIFLLAGGAIGKFVCGWLNDRYGSVSLIWGTKGLTALLFVAAVYTPPWALAPLMVALGIGLNGTSSVLYATVASFVPPSRRGRMYGYFYTTNEGGTFLLPVLYGRLADVFDLRITMVAMGLVTALILPVSLALRRYLARSPTWQPSSEG